MRHYTGERSVSLRRILRVAVLLRRRHWHSDDLAREAGCVARTIFRDIQLLEEFHAPIVYDPIRGFRMLGPVPFVETESKKASAA